MTKKDPESSSGGQFRNISSNEVRSSHFTRTIKVTMKKILPVVTVLLFSIFTVLPLFHAGLFPMHDDTQVQRVFEMAQSLKDGMFPVRWVNDLGYGYGYPIFNFYAPLAYYVGGLFVLFGFSSLIATKIMIAIGMLLAGIGMYYLGKFLWGIYGGIIAGIFYSFATYHAVDLFVRGDVSELWAYGLLPLAAFGLLALAKEKKWQYFLLASLSFAGIILSHNLTAMMVTPVLLLIVLYSSIRYKNLFALLPFATGLLLAGFYWLPAITETGYTNVLAQIGGAADFHKHFVCPMQFWYSPWGYGGSTVGCNDGISFMVGKMLLACSVIGVVLSLFFFKKKKEQVLLTVVLFLGFLFSLFIQTDYSIFLWNMIKTMAFFQYPWRFLILTSFFASLLSGSIFYFLQAVKFPQKLHIGVLFLTTVIILLTVWMQGKFFMPQRYEIFPSEYYTNKDMLTFTTSKISDEYMPKGFTTPKTISQVPTSFVSSKNGQVIASKTQEKIIQVNFPKDTVVLFSLAYFPAWKFFIDNQLALLQPVSHGVTAQVLAGKHILTFVYQQTPFELAGDILSCAGILFLLLGIMAMRKICI